MKRQALPLLCANVVAVLSLSVSSSQAEQIEVLRDPWGIPHIFATADAGAFYGLGYATAEDRAFQMTYSLRIIQGRLAETVGDVRMLNRNETSVDSDRKMRTIGFHRAARRTAANLDPETRALLLAYCDGVNDYFARHREDLHPLFARLGVKPEPWTPADCLASWWHLGQFFATDGTRELIAGRNAADSGQGRSARGQGRPSLPGRNPNRPALPADVKPMPADDGPAVVKRADVTTNWIERVERYAREHGLQAAGDGAEGPKFSHAWVVGGQRTTTGSSVLMSDPQTAVRNPSLFYEFHLQGKTFNARGIGVPGSPIILIGFSEQVAWGVTALGADQADLFLLETDPAWADQYRFDGQWRPMTVHRETILVKGGNPIEWIVRETHLGPVATAFCFAQPGDGEVALKRIPICQTNRETIQGAIAMMRARNAREFHTALNGWQFPSVNMLFGDREGNIGYRAAAAIPVRSREDADSGRKAMPGRTTKHDWQELLPGDLLPQVSNPKAGFLYSGNHRPIESWYPLPLGAMTGAGGDTVRSWRLRERLEAKAKFSPEEVRDIHYDTVNPARREIVRLGLHLRDGLNRKLSDDARQALAHMEPWYRAGASSSLAAKGAELATELNTFFRFMNTDLALVYGGGESGLAYFLKTAAARLERDPKADFSPVEQAYLDQVLAGAWQSARQKFGEDSPAWNDRARQGVRQRRLGYFESLDGFPSLDRAQDLPFPALTDLDGGTIASQASQSYTQWVPMHDPDQAQSILPIGQSERPDSPSRTSTMELWSEGKLHPAPLSRAKVEPLVVSRKTLPAADREPSNDEPPASSIRQGAPGTTSQARSESPPASQAVRMIAPLAYSQDAPDAQVLSACLVQSPQPSPVLVQIISGGWNSSPPQRTPQAILQPYLDAGLSVVMVAHRSINDTVHWPAPADDVARAIQFIRAHATEWGIDPKRIAVQGRSSGGHVALMVGFGPDQAKPDSPDPVARQSSRPTCILAGSAPTDLALQMSELLKNSNRQDYLWNRMCALLGTGREELTVEELTQRLKPLSPIEIVTRDAPPVLLMHPGPADAFWPGDARLKWDVHTPITGLILAKKLKELGVPHELVMLPKGPAGRGGGQPAGREMAFLRQHLKLAGGRTAGPIHIPLTPPQGRVVHGMGQWEAYNTKLLPALPAAVRPAAQLLFIDIGDTPRGWRPEGVAARLQALGRDGYVPVLDIGLRGNQPNKAELDQRADKLFGIDHEVASSTRFDSRLKDLAEAIRAFGQPVLVRIGGEFNGWWNGYHPYAYPQAFRKIVGMFREVGVTNAAFVWCYEPSAPGDFAEQNAQGEWKWFPGDDVVDWFSIDWFNKEDFTGPLVGGRQGREPTAHGRSRKFLDLAVAHRKPVIIAESAPCRYDLSDPKQAEAAWHEWFEPYFQIIAERPEIKWFHLISYDWTRASYFAQTGWKNNDFTANPTLLNRLIEELKKPRYLHASERGKLAGYEAMPLMGTTTNASANAGRSRGNEAVKAEVERSLPKTPATPERSSDQSTEMAKWDDADKHRSQTGPGGTGWDSQYRSFIQTDENATSKGFLTHAEAAKQVLADAATSPDNLRRHKLWVLYIKHFSQAYRPDSATADLKRLYEDLVAMESGGAARKPTLPFDNDLRLTIHRDVVYGKIAPDMQRVDAYLVKSDRPTPVLIEFHGGGWRRGAKSQFIYSAGLIEAILAAGISVISVDYRLTPKHPFPAQVEDAARVVQFVRSKAKEWNLDPERIVAMGGSAGAHLSAWVALHDDLARPDSPDPVERHSTRVRGFVDLWGPMDLTRVRPTELAKTGLRGADFADAFTGAFACTAEAFERDPDVRRRVLQASPLFLVTRDDPPALIVHTAGEDMAPGKHPPVPEVVNDPHSAWHGALLADAMREAGLEVVCRIGPSVGRNAQGDNAAIIDFLRRRILARSNQPGTE